MRSDRRNMPEQELSIKEREQELFVEPSDPSAPPTSVKPFAIYLRETPANPLSTEVKAILWAIGLVVLLLFALAIWRSQRSHRSRPKPQASEAAATAQVTPPTGSVRLSGLEAAGAQEFELGPLGKERVDFAVDELIALDVFALLGDDPPAEDSDLLDGVGVRDRLDGVYGLDAGETSHGILGSFKSSFADVGGSFQPDVVGELL